PTLAPTSALTWEPPVDVLETGREVLVLVALPGVDPDRVEVAIEGDDLVVVGTRVLPPELRTAMIHRLELPQGQFARRVRLPAGPARPCTGASPSPCRKRGPDMADLEKLRGETPSDNVHMSARESAGGTAPSYPPIPLDAMIIVPVRNAVLFPEQVMPIMVGR